MCIVCFVLVPGFVVKFTKTRIIFITTEEPNRLFNSRATLPLSMNDLISQDCSCNHLPNNMNNRAAGSNYGNDVTENLNLYDNGEVSKRVSLKSFVSYV